MNNNIINYYYLHDYILSILCVDERFHRTVKPH